MKAERYRWIAGAGQFPVADVEQWLGPDPPVLTSDYQPATSVQTDSTHNCIGIAGHQFFIERAFHTNSSVLLPNPGGNSPTDTEQHQRCCHGLISDQLYI